MGGQIRGSKEHAGQFRGTLDKAQKRFVALVRVEERDANHSPQDAAVQGATLNSNVVRRRDQPGGSTVTL